MIDRELLGKIMGKTDKDDDFCTDVPPEWIEGKTGDKKKERNKKAAEKGRMSTNEKFADAFMKVTKSIMMLVYSCIILFFLVSCWGFLI